MRPAREHRIEEGCGALESLCQVGLETNLLGEAAIEGCPLGRWGRQTSGKRLAGADLKGVLQRPSHCGGFERLRVRNEQDVDQVLGPRAGPARRAIAPRVSVDLLGQVLGKRSRGKLKRLDAREGLNPVLSASVFIRCSSAMRKAAALSYLTRSPS